MRHVSFLLAAVFVLSALTVGCGDPGHNPNIGNGPVRVTSFNPPSISGLSPNNAPVNSVPFAVEVDGKNFANDAVVFWSGQVVPTVFASSQKLYAQLSSTDLLYSGMIKVYVHTSGLNSNTVEFDLQ